jgi:hypothetical protein
MWTRSSGRTGIKFSRIAAAEQKNLTAWLDSLLPYKIEAIPRPAVRYERNLAERHA